MDAHTPPDLELRLGSDLSAIATLTVAFSAWAARAALAQRDIFQVSLALEELVTNVIVHGFGTPRKAQDGWMRLRVALRIDTLTIELRDNAAPFDPFRLPPPPLDADIDTAVGGLGVHFVRVLMDECSYARDVEQNVVRLRKRLGSK